MNFKILISILLEFKVYRRLRRKFKNLTQTSFRASTKVTKRRQSKKPNTKVKAQQTTIDLNRSSFLSQLTFSQAKLDANCKEVWVFPCSREWRANFWTLEKMHKFNHSTMIIKAKLKRNFKRQLVPSSTRRDSWLGHLHLYMLVSKAVYRCPRKTLNSLAASSFSTNLPVNFQQNLGAVKPKFFHHSAEMTLNLFTLNRKLASKSKRRQVKLRLTFKLAIRALMRRRPSQKYGVISISISNFFLTARARKKQFSCIWIQTTTVTLTICKLPPMSIANQKSTTL